MTRVRGSFGLEASHSRRSYPFRWPSGRCAFCCARRSFAGHALASPPGRPIAHQWRHVSVCACREASRPPSCPSQPFPRGVPWLPAGPFLAMRTPTWLCVWFLAPTRNLAAGLRQPGGGRYSRFLLGVSVSSGLFTQRNLIPILVDVTNGGSAGEQIIRTAGVKVQTAYRYIRLTGDA